MQNITIMDWLINKPIEITDMPENLEPEVWQMIKYIDEGKVMIWSYIWYYIPTNKQWKFAGVLEWEAKNRFERHQKKASDYFLIFKKEFKTFFPQTKPVTARVNFDTTCQ